MDGELWDGVYRAVCMMGSRMTRPAGVCFSNTRIVLVFLWAVLHDRPTSWACHAAHWPATQRDEPLPSPATMSRRLRTVSVQQLIENVLWELRDQLPTSVVKTLDAKPMPVGGYTKDRDAKRGRATNGMAKGYKLFAVCEGIVALDRWRIGPMNQSEVDTAKTLVPEVAARFGSGYFLGDALYDSNPLYDIVGAWDSQLVAPRKQPDAGWGHRTHSPGRRRSAELLDTPFGRTLYACRTGIERYFGHLGNFGGGLGPLPNWVRRPRRVALWVAGKMIINQVRILRKRTKARIAA